MRLGRVMATLAPSYLPRRPTETVLYRAVRENLETFLAYTRETYERPLPRYVEQELRAFLRCGVFSHGSTRSDPVQQLLNRGRGSHHAEASSARGAACRDPEGRSRQGHRESR